MTEQNPNSTPNNNSNRSAQDPRSGWNSANQAPYPQQDPRSGWNFQNPNQYQQQDPRNFQYPNYQGNPQAPYPQNPVSQRGPQPNQQPQFQTPRNQAMQQNPSGFQNQPQDQALSNAPQTAATNKPDKAKKDWGELFSRIFVGTLTTFIVVYMGWLFAPDIRNSMTFWPTNTPTPVTPTATIPATATVTPLATNTPTAAPTATPGPISNYWIRDGSTLDPVVPNAPEGLVILSVNNSAEVNPALDSLYWTSSKQIVQDLGNMNSLYDSEWYATLSNGSARFFMDRTLHEGLYEIYVMDTYYSSGGTLDYFVKVGEQILSPLTSSQTVNFMTSQYEPIQYMDTWRSLGIYYVLPSSDVLTVSTSWNMRDEYSYVAIDRVMIVPRKMTDLGLLNKLPSGGIKYILDDTQAEIIAGGNLIKETDNVAWDDSYQLILNPKEKASVTYTSKEPWPIGKYDVYLYFPESKGGIDAVVELFTDSKLLNTDEGIDRVALHIPAGGNWSKIGSYTTDRYYERPVKFKVSITIEEGANGEYPVDAIAFIQKPFE